MANLTVTLMCVRHGHYNHYLGTFGIYLLHINLIKAYFIEIEETFCDRSALKALNGTLLFLLFHLKDVVQRG